jgi:Ran GTPase-activating protein (RanGAP) involved in mRNA processing and transport
LGWTPYHITISDEVGDKLIKALAGHIGLKKLDLIKIQIGREGCTAISSLLQNPHSKLTLLGFHNNQIDNEGAMILSSALNGNNAIREFKLCNNLHARYCISNHPRGC